ncbi:excinuclease ABC subunit UvrC [Mobilitalea sibirica]|uniref:UvrABC system protein C n=1 Tax=Mobilitalea sibirica TaxID=1462919 RepID=A0A8J7H6K2_9FIRM|nr:excinuclease ABC subunit UvrC [Mobilitalea sibirica]MBH1942554.1 excinuclease ABC subunit UvrC [Mobilitalea sibirica]
MFHIEEELKKLPAKPGVYIMRDEKDNIIYVGKAIILKNRVRQYFQNSRNLTPKIRQMVEKIDHFEYIITDSELEALVLECNLIKEHMPKYNTMLKDDKTYPYIRVTVNEPYPRVFFSREMKKDKAKYFGPYTSAGAVKDILDLLRKVYKIRTCSRNLPKDIGKERPCLYYHMGQCDAPCQGYISKEDYRRNIDGVMEFLNGNYAPVVKMLESRMQEAAENLEFEKAAELRDLLSRVKQIVNKQKITSTDQIDRDIIAFARDKDEAVVQTFFIRSGKLIGRDHFHLSGVEGESDSQVMTSFIKQFYAGTPYIPKEIFLGVKADEEELIIEWLSARRGQKVHLKVPQKGEKERLVDLARKNAELVLNQDVEKIKREEARTTGALKELAKMLDLALIERIESFDISNTSGFETVGSMVVYEKGKPKKADYRKFKIKSIHGPDDYAAMYEMLTRRFTHGQKEQEALREKQLDESLGSFTKYPDLILMDGGKGQVGIALKVLNELKINIAVCGMVKDDNHRTRGLYYNNQELPIDKSSELFKLITRIQDETHRFAIEYHRSLRQKAQVRSILDNINGVGPTRRRALMKYFKSMEAIQEADIEEIMKVPAMNRKSAEQVYEYFHKPRE